MLHESCPVVMFYLAVDSSFVCWFKRIAVIEFCNPLLISLVA